MLRARYHEHPEFMDAKGAGEGFPLYGEEFFRPRNCSNNDLDGELDLDSKFMYGKMHVSSRPTVLKSSPRICFYHII